MIRTLCRWWFVLAVILFLAGVGRGDEGDKIRACLEENFAAYNAEDVPRLVKSLSPTIPGREEFARQSTKLFAEGDAYISIRDFEMLEIQPPFATARVIQGTMRSQDMPEPSEREAYYRENSKLLPSEEEVEYVQSFKKEGGKWRLWAIVSETKTPYVGYTDDGVYHGPNAKEINAANGVVMKSYCPNGNCSFPRVSSR